VRHGLLVEGLAFTNVDIGLQGSMIMVRRSVYRVEKRVVTKKIIEDERISHFVEAKLAGSLKTAKPVKVCIRLVVNLAIQCT
jgi:hypothetical protein